MNKNNNIIEINGQRYDASTGAALDNHLSAKGKANHQTVDTGNQSGAKAPSAKQIPVQHGHQPKTTKPHKKRPIHDVVRRSAKRPAGHGPQPAKTLMRDAVKKPASSFKRHLKAHGRTDAPAKRPSLSIAPKLSAYDLDTKRLQHARQVAKSRLVRRFNQASVIATPPSPVMQSDKKPAVASRPLSKPAGPKRPKAKTTADLLQHALQHATSHQEPPPKKHPKRRSKLSKRITSISAIALAIAVLAGFVTFQNLTNVQLHVASTKAGFAASLPSHQPAGYHLSHLNYSAGVVSMRFQSNSDNRSYAITEKTSAWDSETLRDRFVSLAGQDYQTVTTASQVLYLYGKNAATWVDRGVWYQVQTNGSLSNHQLVELASSM